MGLLRAGRGGQPAELDLGGVPGAAARGDLRRHPLRHQVVEVRHPVGRRLGRHPARRRRHVGLLPGGHLRRWLYDQPPPRRRDERPGVGGRHLRRGTPGPRARRPGPAARPAPVLLEERQVGARAGPGQVQRARLLGDLRLPRPRGPVARAAVQRRLTWLEARLVDTRAETPRVQRLSFDVPGWSGPLAGQHVDVRLTAEDGYSAQRSYSLASPPEEPGLHLLVERFDGGEVSPYLTDEMRAGDVLGLRGPIGGYFVWSAEADRATPVEHRRPVQLVAGGAGVAPLIAMLEHHRRAGSPTPIQLLYSARTAEDVLARDLL